MTFFKFWCGKGIVIPALIKKLITISNSWKLSLSKRWEVNEVNI